MGRTIDVSGWPLRAFQVAWAAAIVMGFVGMGAVIVGRLLASVGISPTYSWGQLAVGLGAVWFVATLGFLWHSSRHDRHWWSGVPPNQYLGRFAGSGGLARHSWERAIDRLPGDEDE